MKADRKRKKSKKSIRLKKLKARAEVSRDFGSDNIFSVWESRIEKYALKLNEDFKVFFASNIPADFWGIKSNQRLKLLTKERVVRKLIGIATKELGVVGFGYVGNEYFFKNEHYVQFDGVGCLNNVRSAAYKIQSKIKIVLQSADNICRYAAEMKQIKASLANQRKLYTDECQSQCDIMLQVNITRRFHISKWITPELKLQGPHKLLYGYR